MLQVEDQPAWTSAPVSHTVRGRVANYVRYVPIQTSWENSTNTIVLRMASQNP
jgi:hypothetical protein